MSHYFSLMQAGRSFAAAITAISRRPKHFFEEMPAATRYAEGIVFLSLVMLFPATASIYFVSPTEMPALVPAIIAAGLFLTWLWTEYLYWSAQLLARVEIKKQTAFQLSSYASVPLILYATIVLAPPAFFWQLYLNWRGLVSHAGIDGDTASLIIALPVIMLITMSTAMVMMLALIGFDIVTPVLEAWGIVEPATEGINGHYPNTF